MRPRRGAARCRAMGSTCVASLSVWWREAFRHHRHPCRHCERSEAIHRAAKRKNGLLRRFAPRNDEDGGTSRFDKMAIASIKISETPLVLYALRRADDALISGHRLSEWCGHAPMLEEDMA